MSNQSQYNTLIEIPLVINILKMVIKTVLLPNKETVWHRKSR